MDPTKGIEQPIEEPKKRGRPIDRPPKETKPRGKPIIIKQPKDPKQRGRKEEGSQSQNTEPVVSRPRGRPRIYSKGTNGRPKDINYSF